MPRSFRFEPPEPRRALVRPRLLRALLGRWDHRVTVVVGGPGLGKTTLLAQAMSENALAPRGTDVWVGLETYDSEGSSLPQALASVLATAGNGDRRRAEPTSPPGRRAHEPLTLAEAIWQRSPRHVCVILDDVHLLGVGTGGTRWLAAFVDALPANGHVVLAGRTDPAIPLARLDGLGAVLRLDEPELRLTAGELHTFAAQRGASETVLDATGGWPAMAELAARTGKRHADQYLWEEVLRPLGAERRRILGVVSDLGGADDRLVTAALGRPVELTRDLADVPLVARGADGWHVPHALWRTAPGLALSADDQAGVRRRAVADLIDRDRLDQAFALVEEAKLWDVAPNVLRAACLESERLNPGQLERYLAACPHSVRTTPAGWLATAMRLAFTQPLAAVEPLRVAARECRAVDDHEAELTALAQLGRLAWGRQDVASIGGEVTSRIVEIEAAGNQMARGLGAFIRALAADLAGDDDRVLAELDAIEPGVLDPVWTAMATWLRGGILLDRGEARQVAAMADAVALTGDPAITAIRGGLRARAWWALGRMDDLLDDIPPLLDALRAAGVASIHTQGLINASLALSHTGNPEAARDCLAAAESVTGSDAGRPASRLALARSSLALADGDEAGATATLRQELDASGEPVRSADRRVWRHVLALSYVLVPETRSYWESANLRGHQAFSRQLARALVEARGPHGQERLWRVDVSDPARVRAALHVRHAAELAVHLARAGRLEGAALLDALGPPGRAAVTDLADGERMLAGPVRALLARLPTPPRLTTHVGTLGPLTVSHSDHDGGNRREVVDPDLRRSRVRALLSYLVCHRRTHRRAIIAALWPDLDDRAAGNNLGVTLNHLLRALEPWRKPGEASSLVRLDGQTVELVTGRFLHVDVDDFDGHAAAASRSEADGNPSATLHHDLEATSLYRGAFFADLDDAEWLDLDRLHYHTRFVAMAVRGAQLLLGRDELDRAEALARRALEEDPWNEDAHTVLAGAALARGDIAGARLAIQHCFSMLTDIDAEPSEATRQLSRRCGIPDAAQPH